MMVTLVEVFRVIVGLDDVRARNTWPMEVKEDCERKFSAFLLTI
jgi:hypothetical protein